MVSADLVDRFTAGALGAGAEVFQVRDISGALAATALLFSKESIRTAVASRSLLDVTQEGGLAIGPSEEIDDIAAAQAGLVLADYGAAETGTLVHLDSDDAERLVWTLPPLCVCLLERRKIVPDLESLAGVISGHLGRTGLPGPQVSLITGPSRTADIECQLTIGVQGPARLVILVIGAEDA
jgi:L-lactate dehydrogenase complex protein LldG